MRFNISSGLIAIAFLLVISAPPSASARAQRAAASASHKAKDAPVSAAAPKDAAERALMQLSQDGISALRAIRSARIALFNGKPEIVSQLLDSAEASLRTAENEAPSFTIKASETINGKDAESATASQKLDLIPIDATLALADNYVPTRENQAHIAKANEHLKNGEQKAAIEELRLAEVDLKYTRILMPIEATKKHVDQAVQLLGEHKYYEANLALKAVDDGLTVETVNLVDQTSRQGAGAQKPAAK
ncbi:YfdX family protein [Methylocystis sp.]|uniref:YfdX family protein n=1 Tax=Methylocystis sp. TaxID=1911079 RepID=UPI003D0FA090